MQIGTGGSINGSSGVVNNGLLAFNLSGTATFLPPVSGSGGLTQMGPGLVALGGVNTYTGPTIISGGTLSFATLPSFGSEIARYAFDGPLGSIAAGTAIPDATGNHPGIMVGNGASYAPGVFGQSLQLAGSTGTYVSVPYSSAFSNLTNFTVSSWVYFPANGGGAILNTRGGGNYGMDEYVRANGDGSNFTVNVEIPGPTNWSVAVGPSAGRTGQQLVHGHHDGRALGLRDLRRWQRDLLGRVSKRAVECHLPGGPEPALDRGGL